MRNYSKSFMRKNNGFTLVEMILGLSLCTLILPICMGILKTMTKVPLQGDIMKDRIAIHQLRTIYAEAGEVDIEDDEQLYLLYRDEDTLLLLDKGRLVKEPGYQIFMEDVKELSFFETDKCIYMKWSHQNETTSKTLLGC